MGWTRALMGMAVSWPPLVQDKLQEGLLAQRFERVENLDFIQAHLTLGHSLCLVVIPEGGGQELVV